MIVIGECSSLGLSGRKAGVGLLATSTLYRYGDTLYCFTPEVRLAIQYPLRPECSQCVTV